MSLSVMGAAEPRISSPSRAVTTTRGHELIEFAESVGVELMPWQKTLALRGLETNPDGGWRYKTVVVLVGRQSGKTTFCKLLALWRMVHEPKSLVLGAAQSMDISKEAWAGAAELAVEHGFAEERKVRRANGDVCLTLLNGSRYRIAATSAGAGRGLSVDLLVMDEARMQRDFTAWSALSKTTIARPNSQTWVISNAGDAESVLLNTLREKGVTGSDEALGLFEWSADPSLDIADPVGWAQGCPGIGHTVPLSAIEAAFGTDPPAVFRTEIRCERVVSLDGAVDMQAWGASFDPAMTLDAYRSSVRLCLDVSVDGSHASLVAAVVDDKGRVRLEPVAAWEGAREAARGLPGWLERVKPAAWGWFPGGPAARVAAEIGLLGGQEITGPAAQRACMAFADEVQAGNVLHGGDPLLTQHVGAAQKYWQGETWRFARPRQGGDVDAAYAAAGALYLARVAAAKPARPKVFVV
ncbi:MAG: terminase [Actinomycetota bacterium]|nr:terminase [Actinomycetota bacterium]